MLHRFVVLAKRCIVEPTFAWFGTYRRVTKDHERPTESSVSMILIAMNHPDSSSTVPRIGDFSSTF